jgi:hypothetical protein
MLKAIREVEGVRSAELDYQLTELRVDYDSRLTDEEAVPDAERDRGYRCDGDPGGASTSQLAHGAELAPIPCGTKCDRLQYELPHTRAEEQHRHSSEEATYDGHGGDVA